MPSPSICRSTSDQNLFKPQHPCRNHIPTSSDRSGKPRLGKKVGKLMVSRKTSTSLWDLTEEKLQEHNRRHKKRGEDKNSKCSPYYKGLTDSSLVINRQQQRVSVLSSPGRESHATTFATSRSSASSFKARLQEWTSCFTFKNGQNHATTPASSSSNSKSRQVMEKKAVANVHERDVLVKQNKKASSVEHKPLTACFSEPELASPPSILVAKQVPPPTLVPEPEPAAAAPPTPIPEPEQAPAPLTLLLEPQPSGAAPTTVSLPGATKTIIVKETVIRTEKGNERDFIWADKHRPKALQDFICNRDKAMHLDGLVKAGEYHHFIFQGPAGVGKRTMIWAFLRETFGAEKVETREECKEFNLKGESISSIQVKVLQSSQHVEVNLSELKGYEKHVIVQLITEKHNKVSNGDLHNHPDTFKAIILYEADKLSTDALLYIRWLLERYKGCNKVFFCCSDVSRLHPIKSLCNIIQLLPPSNKEIVEVLEFIASQEGIELPHMLAERIAANSKNNLRQAIRSFEASWQISYPFKEDQVIITGWEDDIANIAKNIVEEQSPKQLYTIRGKLQNLTDHSVSPDFIFKSLVEELKKQVHDQLKLQIVSLYEEYNRDEESMFDEERPSVFGRSGNEQMGKTLNDPRRKEVHVFLKIEEFIAKVMSCYKNCQVVMNSKAHTLQQILKPDADSLTIFHY